MQVWNTAEIHSNIFIVFILYFCLQEPFCPPRPSLPEESVASSEYARDLTDLFTVSEGGITGDFPSKLPSKLFSQDSRHADLIFVCSDGRGVSGHRVVVAATCPALRSLLSLDLGEDQQAQPALASSSQSLLQLTTSGSTTVSPSQSLQYE